MHAFHEPSPENGMSKILPSLIQALDGIMPCCGAVPQSVDLRKNVPHPVRALQAAPQLGKGAVIDPFLRADEAVQIIGIAAIGCAVSLYHAGLLE